MATTKASRLRNPATRFIREALVEGKLITEKCARDAVYLATLAEELHSVEAKISAMETAANLTSVADVAKTVPHDANVDLPDAHWIRTKSCELDKRLRRIEQLSHRR